MIVKSIIILALLIILLCLASALYHLVKDKERGERTARALTARIALSIALFVFLMIAFSTGLLKPHGLNPGAASQIDVDP